MSAERERIRLHDGHAHRDRVAEEAPLTLLIGGEALVTTMRTPAQDEELALGFLRAEGIVRSVDQVTFSPRSGGLELRPAPGFCFDLDGIDRRRGTLSQSSCGVCGRAHIDDLLERLSKLPEGPKVCHTLPLRALSALDAGMRVFQKTGATHGAAAFDTDGELLVLREDVGRHNAVDKVVGALLREGTLENAALLALSGRASFEVVQKAAAAEIPIVATRKGTTTLAIDIAERAGVTLVGFVREGGGQSYTHGERFVRSDVPHGRAGVAKAT